MVRARALTAGLLVLGACTTPIIESNDTADETETETSSGDGDGDPGDGDGDGDGDGVPGDGDGDGTGVGVCGDGIVDADEQCDDANEIDTDACVACQDAACGDGFVHEGVEACDDGVNDGAYEGCAVGCASLGPYCGDAEVNGAEECDDGNSTATDGCFANCLIARSCKDIDAFAGNAPTGESTIDLDGPGPEAPLQVWCEQALDGGGWQLISVRYGDVDTLFVDDICLSVDGDCSGTIPAAQIGIASPKLLFATLDGDHWLRLAGLDAPGDDGLIDVITLLRPLSDSNSCLYPHYCNVNIDPAIEIEAHSPNWTPRSLTIPAQIGRDGGLWFAEDAGMPEYHVFSFNYPANMACKGGLTLSDNSDATLGNVVCAQPGALYFRY